MPDKITFEEPPGKIWPGRLAHAVIAATLREKPGRWAIVDRRPNGSSARGMAYLISHGDRLKSYKPTGSFEAMARTVDVRAEDGSRVKEFRVYARYVGQAASE